jgi:hypothetical protein
MYNVGPYTVADYKVIWRRMDKRLTAAVVEPIDHPLVGRRAIVPQETCVLVACDSAEEGHYLCAMLSSEPAGRLLESHSVRSGKGFGTPSILDYLPIRRYDLESPLHQELSACSREAHRIVRAATGEEATIDRQTGKPRCASELLDEIQRRINRLANEAFQTR